MTPPRPVPVDAAIDDAIDNVAAALELVDPVVDEMLPDVVRYLDNDDTRAQILDAAEDVRLAWAHLTRAITALRPIARGNTP